MAQHALQHFQEKLQQTSTKELHNPKPPAQQAEVLQTLLLWLASYR